METGRVIVSIENVVAAASLNQILDLESLVKAFPNVEYNPQEFPGLVYRLKKPRTVALLFGSGRMVCAGAKSERTARRAVLRIVQDLKRGGIVILEKPEIKVQNIVASANLCGVIDLEDTASLLRGTIYEPEQFPGMIYRMEKPKVVLLLFANGRIVCVGAKTESEVHQAIAQLRETLLEKRLLTITSSV